MHELGVVFHVIKIVEEVAAENQLTEVESVTLELGEVSGVIESYLQNCWNKSMLLPIQINPIKTLTAINFQRTTTVMNSVMNKQIS